MNTEVMQLDLFEGVVLTTEQEQMIAEFKQDTAKRAERRAVEIKQNEEMLIEAGFLRNVDFKNTFEIVEVTKDVTLGSTWRDNQFEAKDVTYTTSKGNLSLLGKRFNKDLNKVVDVEYNYFQVENGKIECSNITGNYRKVKPTTLRDKLHEQNRQAETNLETYNQKVVAFETAKADLVAKCPNAQVVEITDYDSFGRNYRTTKRLKVQFENGSYVTFNVRLDGTYSMAKRYDAEIVAMTADETLEFFANQNK